jgi:predicted nucleic acid-binding protein
MHALTSWVICGEVLGVLKRKTLNGELTREEYCESVELMFYLLRKGKIEPIDIDVSDGSGHLRIYTVELTAAFRRHPQLDAADALQLIVIRDAYIRKRLIIKQFVTADAGLARAAIKEGIPTIRVNSDK